MIEILEPIKDNNKLTYPIIINNKLYNFDIEYDSSEISLNSDIDGIVCLMVSLAICNKWTITSKLPIDSKLYDNLQNIVNLYKKYHHKHTYLLSHITKDELNLVLDLPIVQRDKCNSGIKTSSFSMGIDSVHTILKHSEITHIVYIEDLDIAYHVKNFKKILVEFANKYNKTLINVKTNFKKIFACIRDIPGTNYAVFLNDPMIFALIYPLQVEAHYFNGMGGEIPCIMGQNSVLDKSMEGNNLDIYIDLTPRICKLKYILEKDITLLNKLRYCNEFLKKNNGIIINCMNCGKCLRTLLYFYMLGYYDKLVNLPEINGDFLTYYLNTYYNNPNTLLAYTYYEKIFTKVLEIYKNGDIDNIYNYKFSFNDNDECIVSL